MKVTEQLRTLAINFNGKYEYRQMSVELDKLEKIELERELLVEDYDGFVDALMLVQPSTVREIDIINQIFDTIGWIESETDESDAPATEPAEGTSVPTEVEEPASAPAAEPAEAEVEEAEEPTEASEATTETEEAEEAEESEESTEAPKEKKSKGKK